MSKFPWMYEKVFLIILSTVVNAHVKTKKMETKNGPEMEMRKLRILITIFDIYWVLLKMVFQMILGSKCVLYMFSVIMIRDMIW